MTYLLPLNIDYSNFCSKGSYHVPALFKDSTVAEIKQWSGSKLKNIQTTVVTTTHVAMTAIACVAIAYFSKIVLLGGAIATSAIAYNRLARMAEHSEHELVSTMVFQKIIESLSAPKLNKETLTFLKEKLTKNTCDLKAIANKLLFLRRDKTDPEKRLQEDYNRVLKNQGSFIQKLDSLEEKLQLELDRFAKDESLDLAQVDALLEDPTPLINDFAQYVCNLQGIKQDLDNLEEKSLDNEGLPLKNTLLEKHNKIVINAEDLQKELQALQANRSFFKANGDLFSKNN
ncbi:MAG TPA: hypothetical protein VGZ69_06745 [Candidatus Rhabdochlamydia sp.]|jgi:hypothetical protein|nr:hypothetical protein [Candidatus Rhabdochlamydia sp.]